MLGKLFSAPIAKAAGALVLALALACAGLWIWGRAGHASSDRWQARAGVEAANHRQTKANFRSAQDAAAIASRAARLAAEQTSRHLAERADHAQEDLADARTAAARFADARRLQDRARSAVAGAAGSTGARAQADPAASGNGPGADAMVLDRGEFDQLVANTLRLERVRRWGEELITAGLAFPAAPTQKDD